MGGRIELVTHEERARIEAALREGKSQNAVAKESGRSVFTVNKIAHQLGIDTNVSATKRATAARLDYAQAARVEMLNEAFDKGRQLLARAEDGEEFRHIMFGLGVAIDKRRLEDGESTSRTETVTGEARERLKARLRELRREGA